MANPWVGAFRLVLAAATAAALWNGAGWGAIVVAVALYLLLVPFLR